MLDEIVQALSEATELLEKAVKRKNVAGSYYYEEITLKRWLLGSGGRSGNCEDCVENHDAGWIEEDDFFPAPGAWGYTDEPPLHPHCDCYVEYKDTRRRVYV